MRSPLESGEWIALDEVASTQDEAAERLKRGENVGVLFVRHQSGGRGRFGRPWVSVPGESLTMSLVFSDYADHPHPYLVGMAVAIAAAGAIHSEVRWPNDLVMGGRKVGGILTELVQDAAGRSVPVVGVGINLNQESFPEELIPIATSVAMFDGVHYDPETVARAILDRLPLLPEPSRWSDLAPIWTFFDTTPGKIYHLPDGKDAVAYGVGPQGELLCAVDGESTSVLAADGIFGPSAGR